MTYKILDSKWRSALHSVGFVAYDTGFEGEWNSVVGYVPDVLPVVIDDAVLLHAAGTEEEDAQYIAANGAKLEWQVAAVMFPQLDITKHKYYDKNKA